MIQRFRSKTIRVLISSISLLAAMPSIAQAEVHCLVPPQGTGIEDQVQIALETSQVVTEKETAFLNDSQVRSLLRKALNTKDARAANAARAQLDAEAKRSLSTLGDMLLVHPDPEVRSLLLDILGGAGLRAAPYLIEFESRVRLVSESKLREKTARVLAKLDPRVVDLIRESFSEDPEETLRPLFIGALGESGGRGLPLLVEALKKAKSSGDRTDILLALGRTGKKAMPHLEAALKKNPDIATVAILESGAVDLGRMETLFRAGSVNLPSGAALKLSNLTLSMQIRFLGRLGPKGLPGLVKLTQRDGIHGDEREEIISAVFNTGSPEAESVVHQLLKKGFVTAFNLLNALDPSRAELKQVPRLKNVDFALEIIRGVRMAGSDQYSTMKRLVENFEPKDKLFQAIVSDLRNPKLRSKNDHFTTLAFFGEKALPILSDSLKDPAFKNSTSGILMGLSLVGPKAFPTIDGFLRDLNHGPNSVFEIAFHVRNLILNGPTMLDEQGELFVDQILMPRIQEIRDEIGGVALANATKKFGAPAIKLFQGVDSNQNLMSDVKFEKADDMAIAMASVANIDAGNVKTLLEAEGKIKPLRFLVALEGLSNLPSNRYGALLQDVQFNTGFNAEFLASTNRVARKALRMPKAFRNLDPENYPLSVLEGHRAPTRKALMINSTSDRDLKGEAMAMIKHSGPGAIEFLDELQKKTPVRDIRLGLFRQIGTMKDEGLTLLENILRSPESQEIHFAAMEAIAIDKSDRAMSILQNVMKSNSQVNMRGRSSDLLIDNFGRRALPALKEALSKENEARVRASIASKLHKLGRPAVPVLIGSLLKDSDPAVQKGSSESFAQLLQDQPSIVRELLPLLKSADPFVRANMAVTVAISSDESVVAPLKTLLNDADEGVRVAALNAIGNLPEDLRSSAVPQIRKLLKDESGLVRFQAQRVLQDSKL